VNVNVMEAKASASSKLKLQQAEETTNVGVDSMAEADLIDPQLTTNFSRSLSSYPTCKLKVRSSARE
jgi:hypothetical protein